MLFPLEFSIWVNESSRIPLWVEIRHSKIRTQVAIDQLECFRWPWTHRCSCTGSNENITTKSTSQLTSIQEEIPRNFRRQHYASGTFNRKANIHSLSLWFNAIGRQIIPKSDRGKLAVRRASYWWMWTVFRTLYRFVFVTMISMWFAHSAEPLGWMRLFLTTIVLVS